MGIALLVAIVAVMWLIGDRNRKKTRLTTLQFAALLRMQVDAALPTIDGLIARLQDDSPDNAAPKNGNLDLLRKFESVSQPLHPLVWTWFTYMAVKTGEDLLTQALWFRQVASDLGVLAGEYIEKSQTAHDWDSYSRAHNVLKSGLSEVRTIIERTCDEQSQLKAKPPRPWWFGDARFLGNG